jgi:hypothetical protein
MNHDVERGFRSDRKETQWGKRRLKNDTVGLLPLPSGCGMISTKALRAMQRYNRGPNRWLPA